MKKIRVSGFGLKTSEELFDWADKLEAQINDPQNCDDPRWLRRRAAYLRSRAVKMNKGLEHKEAQKK